MGETTNKVLIIVGDASEHLRVDVAGGNRIRGDALPGRFRGQSLGEAEQPGLGRAVVDLPELTSLTIHRADANRDQRRSRRAIGLIYYSHRAREDQAAHAAYQRKLAAEMRDAGRI